MEFGVGCSLKLGVAHRRAKSPLLTLAFVSLVSPPDCSRRLQENSRIGWKRWRIEVFKYKFKEFRDDIERRTCRENVVTKWEEFIVVGYAEVWEFVV